MLIKPNNTLELSFLIGAIVSFLIMVALLSFSVWTYGGENIDDVPLVSEEKYAYEKVAYHCEKTYAREPMLISPCVTLQFRALHEIESYMVSRLEMQARTGKITKETDIGKLPMMLVLLRAAEEFMIATPYGDWANWIRVKYRFKRDFQAYLISVGENDTMLDYL